MRVDCLAMWDVSQQTTLYICTEFCCQTKTWNFDHQNKSAFLSGTVTTYCHLGTSSSQRALPPFLCVSSFLYRVRGDSRGRDQTTVCSTHNVPRNLTFREIISLYNRVRPIVSLDFSVPPAVLLFFCFLSISFKFHFVFIQLLL